MFLFHIPHISACIHIHLRRVFYVLLGLIVSCVVNCERYSRRECMEHWSAITRHQFYIFVGVQTLFTILDDLEANQDVYYASICDSGKDRYSLKYASRIPISVGNYNESGIDLLRWVAFNADWPFYIERIKVRRRRGTSSTVGPWCVAPIDRVLLRSRPLSWCTVYVTQSARHFYTAFNAARISYREVHKGVAPTSRLLISISDGTFSWVPDDAREGMFNIG